MNVRKLLRARRYLQAAQVDTGDEELFFSGNAQQIEELFRDLTFISHDYPQRQAAEDAGRAAAILNITILPPNDGSAAFANYRRLDLHRGAVVQVGDVLGRVRSADGRVPLRPDKMNRPHPQMEQWLGAARSEDIQGGEDPHQDLSARAGSDAGASASVNLAIQRDFQPGDHHGSCYQIRHRRARSGVAAAIDGINAAAEVRKDQFADLDRQRRQHRLEIHDRRSAGGCDHRSAGRAGARAITGATDCDIGWPIRTAAR
jgi:hypothetical protein